MDAAIHQMYYLRLPSGPPTQADIWDGLPTWGGTQPFCTGILITPRCDLAHDKTAVINYLPILPLNEYLLRIGGFVVIEQELNRLKERLRQTARSLDIREVLDMGLPVDEILDLIGQGRLQTSVSNPKQLDKHIAEFRSLSELHGQLISIVDQDILSEADLALANPREVSLHKRDVIRNKLIDTYFLPPCPPLLPSPSVALLRHVYTCEIEALRNLHKLDEKPMRRPERMLRLKSPFIESLVARLAALFTRVGTRDLPQEAVDELADT
jgi:hypothetical protein